jgi:peptidoglycan/LPS O-acetylase OafA/YrhL
VGVDCYKENESNRFKRIIPAAIVILMLIHVTLVLLVLGIGIDELKGKFIWFFIFGFVCIMLFYVFSFVLVKDIVKALCNVEIHERFCSPKLVSILTFFGFVSIVYLQAYINKRWDLLQ